MRVHNIQAWLPVTFAPIRKSIKPRKTFESEVATEAETKDGASHPAELLDEEKDWHQTDIVA